MSDRRLLHISYICCLVLAVGSFAPWVTGPLGDPAPHVVVPTVVAAGIIAILLRLSVTTHLGQTLLILAAIVATLCAALAIYAVYDVRDLYGDSTDTWTNHIGWGLALSLVAASLLGVLCIRRYRRRHVARKGARALPVISLVSGVTIGIALACWLALAFATDNSESESRWKGGDQSGSIPSYAIRIVGGDMSDRMSSVWLFGEGDDICWGTRSGKDEPDDSFYCGANVPPARWQVIAQGPLSTKRLKRSLVVLVTRGDVGHLRLLTGRGHGGGRQLFWTDVKTHAISRQRARRARLRPGIGYAIAVVRGTPCIRRVAVFDRVGAQVATTPRRACRYSMAETPVDP
jgi:hypothetical protein